VVVVTWEGAHLLGPCLEALAAQTLAPHDFRVLVVDNASTDGTAELLAQRPGIQVVMTERNLGFAGGANAGLRQVTTPYAVVLNNDARPEPDWLECLLAGFRPGVAAVTSKVLLDARYALTGLPGVEPSDIRHVLVDGADVTTNVVARTTAWGVELAVPVPDEVTATVQVTGTAGTTIRTWRVDGSGPRVDVLNSTGGVLTRTGHGADRGYLEVDRGQYDGATEVFAVCGAAAAFRTEIVSNLGWFDPWFFAYYEDLDLSWRLRRAGWKIRYVPGARVRHRHAATSGIGSDLFLFHNRRNRLATLAKNATLREIGQAIVAGRGLANTPHIALLAPTSTAPPGSRPRGRGAALASFLVRLPVLYVARVTRGRPGPSQVVADHR
jgi:GT2 family glycosyltransferase